MQTSVPIVDQVKKLAGCTSTIFQLMSPAGDMLRVATNVAKEDGSRAIGTYTKLRSSLNYGSLWPSLKGEGADAEENQGVRRSAAVG
jgi:hypothetical protein